MRSWISVTSSLAAVVRTAKVLKAKQPYAIGMKDGSAFGLAGLWENWKDPTTDDAPDRLPLEEQVDGHDAAPPAVCVPEHGELLHCLALGVDRRRLRLRLGPVRDEAPAQQVKRALAGVVVLADGPQLLPRGRVVARRHVHEACVGHVEGG